MQSFKAFLAELSNETMASYKRKAKGHLKHRLRDYGNGRKEYYGIEFFHHPGLGAKREQGIKTSEKKLQKRYASVNEDAVVNSAGSGGIAGIGVGPKGEPGFRKRDRARMLRRLLPKKILKTVTNEAIESGPGELRVEEPVVTQSKFAGQHVFQVPSEYFHKARLGKAKYAHYKHYVGKDDVGQTIRNFGNKHYGKPIIVQDQASQHMMYLRYGKGK